MDYHGLMAMMWEDENVRMSLRPHLIARAYLLFSRILERRLALYQKSRLGFCGVDVQIYPGASFIYPEMIYLGDHVHIGHKAHLRGGGKIIIGNWSQVANHTIMATTNHRIGEGKYYGNVEHKDIRIGSNVWIGSGAIILPGATIGDNGVIGAGAVVSGTVEADTIVAGVPAKRIWR